MLPHPSLAVSIVNTRLPRGTRKTPGPPPPARSCARPPPKPASCCSEHWKAAEWGSGYTGSAADSKSSEFWAAEGQAGPGREFQDKGLGCSKGFGFAIQASKDSKFKSFRGENRAEVKFEGRFFRQAPAGSIMIGFCLYSAQSSR